LPWSKQQRSSTPVWLSTCTFQPTNQYHFFVIKKISVSMICPIPLVPSPPLLTHQPWNQNRWITRQRLANTGDCRRV
jgi:hypothetical protein